MSGSSDCFFFYLLSTKKRLEDRHCYGVIYCLLATNVWRVFLRFYLWLWGLWSLRDVADGDINFIHWCRQTGWVIGGDLNLPPCSWSHNFTSAGSEIFDWQMIPYLKWAKVYIGLLLSWRFEAQPLSLDWNHKEVTRNCLEFLVPFSSNRSQNICMSWTLAWPVKGAHKKGGERLLTRAWSDRKRRII